MDVDLGEPNAECHVTGISILIRDSGKPGPPYSKSVLAKGSSKRRVQVVIPSYFDGRPNDVLVYSTTDQGGQSEDSRVRAQ